MSENKTIADAKQHILNQITQTSDVEAIKSLALSCEALSNSEFTALSNIRIQNEIDGFDSADNTSAAASSEVSECSAPEAPDVFFIAGKTIKDVKVSQSSYSETGRSMDMNPDDRYHSAGGSKQTTLYFTDGTEISV